MAPDVATLACSSAGGGLRLAVVGYERVVTAEAGHRVGLSAGARVSYVASGPLDGGGVRQLLDNEPDVVLLVGGTDGGNAEVLLHNAAALASSELRVPVVAAGNVDVRDEVAAVLRDGGKTVYPTVNVLPVIGRLDPQPARETIREVFIRHVIGGKGLSASADFPLSCGPRRPTRCWRVSRCWPTAPQASRGRRRAGRRRRRGDHRRLLGRDAAGRGRRPASRGRRGDVALAHRRGRPRHAVERPGSCRRGVDRAFGRCRRADPAASRGSTARGRAVVPRRLRRGASRRHPAGRARGHRRPPPARSRWQGSARGRPRRRVGRRAAAQ